MRDSLPTLWQIDVSHYSEKARWAPAGKGVEHRRHSPVPGAHMAVALWVTRGAHYTFPVLSIDGRRIGDSTAIVAALEERNPEPPLHPADIAERRRALALEEFFDEELGPYVRQLAWHEFGKDPESFAGLMDRASLFYPLASPAEGPLDPDSPSAKGFEEFRAPLESRRGVEWVREMFRRHRKPAKAPTAAA